METWRFFVPKNMGEILLYIYIYKYISPKREGNRVLLKSIRIFSYLFFFFTQGPGPIFGESSNRLEDYYGVGFKWNTSQRFRNWEDLIIDETRDVSWMVDFVGSIIGKYFIYTYIYDIYTYDIYIYHIYIWYIYIYLHIRIYIYIIYGFYGFCLLGFVLVIFYRFCHS